MNDVLDSILLVGTVNRKSAQASDLVDNLRQRIDMVVSKSKTVSNRPNVYFEVWNDPYISVNSETWIGDLINLAGGTNVFRETVSEWPIIYSEDIIQRDPDIMVFLIIPGVPRFWGSLWLQPASDAEKKTKRVRGIAHGALLI